MIFRLVWVMTKALLIMRSFGEVTHLVVLIWFDYIYVNTCKYTSILLLFISYICLYNYTIHVCKIYCIVIYICILYQLSYIDSNFVCRMVHIKRTSSVTGG